MSKLRVTISFDIPNAQRWFDPKDMASVDGYAETPEDNYRWLWDNDKSAALDFLYEDDPVLAGVKEL